MVENKAQRLEFMTQDVNPLKRPRIHATKLIAPNPADSTPAAR
jgi:hypothetical protein